MPEFALVGHNSKLGKSAWQGPVVISRDQIYMVLQMKRSTAQVGAHFGLLGALIAHGAAKLAGPSQERTCDIAELHPDILNHPDWPLKKWRKGDIQIFPRSDIASVRHPNWSNQVKFTICGETAAFEYGLFKGKKVKQALLDLGWEPQW